MRLRPSVGEYAFDAAGFETLRARLRDGSLSAESARLRRMPAPLSASGGTEKLDLRGVGQVTSQQFARLAERGRAALRNRRVAVLILNGGMATRFGGEPKGVVPVVEAEHESFLWVKLRQVVRLAMAHQAEIPVVLMHSFATAQASREHLERIDWAGLPKHLRHSFSQSILPRLVWTEVVQLRPRVPMTSASATRVTSAPAVDSACASGPTSLATSGTSTMHTRSPGRMP